MQNSFNRELPLIAHVIHHFGVGGMENGIVNLINHMPEDRYRHAIVCLTGYDDFRNRLNKPVELVALNKRAGNDLSLFGKLFKTFRQLEPAIVHTRNLAALEAQIMAVAAGVRARIHGEHGRDIYDLHGANWKYNLLRRGIRPFINQYIAVSKDLEQWLVNTVNVPKNRVTQIYNGVDSVKFLPRKNPRDEIGPPGFCPPDGFVIGSVGRMAEVKDYPGLVRAFLAFLQQVPAARARARLVIVGDGVTRQTCLELLRQAHAEDLAWLPGSRDDIPALMAQFDLFTLPSLGEGISNTILEAMACGLPIVATNVGGNSELVDHAQNGMIVPPADIAAMAQVLLTYYMNIDLARQHGAAGRAKIEACFSMDTMVNGYLSVYDRLCPH